MGTLYVATSKALTDWAGDVGLGKNIFKVGFVDDGTAEEAVAGCAGQSDWKVLDTAPAEGTEEEFLDKLARKEKVVDPNYYPKLKGAKGVVRMNMVSVENSMLVAIALDNREPPKNFKVKPVDVARHILANLTK